MKIDPDTDMVEQNMCYWLGGGMLHVCCMVLCLQACGILTKMVLDEFYATMDQGPRFKFHVEAHLLIKKMTTRL